MSAPDEELSGVPKRRRFVPRIEDVVQAGLAFAIDVEVGLLVGRAFGGRVGAVAGAFVGCMVGTFLAPRVVRAVTRYCDWVRATLPVPDRELDPFLPYLTRVIAATAGRFADSGCARHVAEFRADLPRDEDEEAAFGTVWLFVSALRLLAYVLARRIRKAAWDGTKHLVEEVLASPSLTIAVFGAPVLWVALYLFQEGGFDAVLANLEGIGVLAGWMASLAAGLRRFRRRPRPDSDDPR